MPLGVRLFYPLTLSQLAVVFQQILTVEALFAEVHLNHVPREWSVSSIPCPILCHVLQERHNFHQKKALKRGLG